MNEPIILAGKFREMLDRLAEAGEETRNQMVLIVSSCGGMSDLMRAAIQQQELGAKDLILLRAAGHTLVRDMNFPQMVVLDELPREPLRKDWWNTNNRKRWSK